MNLAPGAWEARILSAEPVLPLNSFLLLIFETESLLVPFISCCVKTPDKSNLKKEGLTLAHSSRDTVLGVKSLPTYVILHVVRKQRETDPGTPLASSFEFSLGPQPRAGGDSIFQVDFPTFINPT